MKQQNGSHHCPTKFRIILKLIVQFQVVSLPPPPRSFSSNFDHRRSVSHCDNFVLNTSVWQQCLSTKSTLCQRRWESWRSRDDLRLPAERCRLVSGVRWRRHFLVPQCRWMCCSLDTPNGPLTATGDQICMANIPQQMMTYNILLLTESFKPTTFTTCQSEGEFKR